MEKSSMPKMAHGPTLARKKGKKNVVTWLYRLLRSMYAVLRRRYCELMVPPELSMPWILAKASTVSKPAGTKQKRRMSIVKG